MANGPRSDHHGVSLTEQQSSFVRFVSKGEEPSTAAKLAGYFDPDRASRRLRADPQIQTAIMRETIEILQSEGVPAARHAILSLIRNEGTPPAVQLKASTWVMETMGIGPKNQSENRDLGSKALEDMTLGELEQIANAAKSRLDQAHTIEGQTLEHLPEQQNNHGNSGSGQNSPPENLDELMS